MAIQKLLFVDANIWLDFYRTRTEAGLSLLKHLDQIAGKIIVTYQIEMEFKKNRHVVMLQGLSALKEVEHVSRPGLFSDARAVRAIAKTQRESAARVKKLRDRYLI